MNRFKIGKKFIGLNDPCFIVAEISANHGGQIKNALTIIRNAKNWPRCYKDTNLHS